ncbi:MAG: hypothetical protein IJ149_07670 [Oscillospiraceae bacterium]|nr:hypothetical protein [Oscillospiraceae bacterium]
MSVIIVTAAFTGCSSKPVTDYTSPNNVVDVTLELHPIEEGVIYDWYDDLEGKTVSVVVNNIDHEYLMPYHGSYGSNTVEVFIDHIDNPDYSYKEGETIVLEVDSVAFRGTKDGKIRQYFINTVLPD